MWNVDMWWNIISVYEKSGICPFSERPILVGSIMLEFWFLVLAKGLQTGLIKMQLMQVVVQLYQIMSLLVIV